MQPGLHPGATTDPLKILLLSHVRDNRDGGASRHYHMVADRLSERGHHVVLRHLDDMGLPSQPKLELLARRLVLPQLVSRHAESFPLADFDVVMSSSGMAYPLFKRWRGREHRPLLVNHVHGLSVYDHDAAVQEHRLGRRPVSIAARVVTGPVVTRWDDAGLRHADAVVVQNLRDRAAVRTRVGEDVDVTVIPSAVHPEVLEAGAAAPALSERQADAVMWFGTWESRKGVSYVPAAFRMLREARPTATLTLGGTGKSQSELLAAFDPRDRDAVRVLPYVSTAEQTRILGTGSIFLFPSLSEGFGLALPEAMAMGLVGVTTSTAFGGDHMTDGVDGRVVAPTSEHLGRAMIELASDDEARMRIADAGRELARTFTVERSVAAYEELFARGR